MTSTQDVEVVLAQRRNEMGQIEQYYVPAYLMRKARTKSRATDPSYPWWEPFKR